MGWGLCGAEPFCPSRPLIFPCLRRMGAAWWEGGGICVVVGCGVWRGEEGPYQPRQTLIKMILSQAHSKLQILQIKGKETSVPKRGVQFSQTTKEPDLHRGAVVSPTPTPADLTRRGSDALLLWG